MKKNKSGKWLEALMGSEGFAALARVVKEGTDK